MLSGHARGVALTATGVLVLSPDSVLTRVLGADLATTLFWRGLAMAAGLCAFILVRDRGRPSKTLQVLKQPQGWGLGLLFALSNILFVTAITHATVADTLGCLSTASIFAAVFSAVFLRERAPLRIWIAAIVIAAGLLMIALGGAGSGFGRLVAIAAAAVFGGTFVLMRATGEGDTIPGLALGGALIALVMALPASPASLTATGIGAVAGLAVVLPLAFGLIGQGPRYLPAAEVSLLMLLETLFGSFWAWLWLSELPTRTTVFAIALILGTLAIFYARQLQVQRRPAA